MTAYARKTDSAEAIAIAAGQGTSMQVLIGADQAPNFALRKFTLEPHGGRPQQTNLVEHEQYRVHGLANVEIGDETFEVEAGASVYIPGRAPHSYTAGADGFAFICVGPNLQDKIELV